MKALQDKFSSEGGDILASEKLVEYFKSQNDLKTSLSVDQIEIMRARYLETKKAVKTTPIVIYFNLKKLMEDSESAARSMNKTPSSVVKTTTPGMA